MFVSWPCRELASNPAPSRVGHHQGHPRGNALTSSEPDAVRDQPSPQRSHPTWPSTAPTPDKGSLLGRSGGRRAIPHGPAAGPGDTCLSRGDGKACLPAGKAALPRRSGGFCLNNESDAWSVQSSRYCIQFVNLLHLRDVMNRKS